MASTSFDLLSSSSPFLSSTCSQELTKNTRYGQGSSAESPAQGATEQHAMGQGGLAVHHIPNGTTMGTVSMSLACLVHQELIANTVQEDLVSDLLSRAPLNLAGL